MCWLQRVAGMLGLRAEDVPSESDEEHVPAGALANQGQVLVSATLPRVLMPWQQGVFRDIFEDPPALQCELPNPQVLLPLTEPAASQASRMSPQERPAASPSQPSAGETPDLAIFSNSIRGVRLSLLPARVGRGQRKVGCSGLCAGPHLRQVRSGCTGHATVPLAPSTGACRPNGWRT